MEYTPLQLLPLPPTATEPNPIPTCLTIDPFSDILWVGSSSGLVTALCSPLSLSRNVQFPAHGAQLSGTYPLVSGVKEIRVTDREVWTLTEGGVGGRKRGGAPKWSFSDPNRRLASMTPNPSNSNEVVAGAASLLIGNMTTGQIVRTVPQTSSTVHLAPQDRGILCASLSGQLSILDPRTGYKVTNSVQAHTGGLSGADAQNNLISTWGWTHTKGHPLPDPLVRLYDVRTLRPLPPISFPAGPAFVRLHPTDSSKLVIASQQGMLQTVDMASGNNGFAQLDVTSYVSSMALSQNGDYLAFGDGEGQLHLWTTHDTSLRDEAGQIKVPPFATGVSPEWPDPTDPPKQIAFDDRTPLNMIGMPFHRESQLLSNFPPADYAKVTSPFFNPPEPIAPSVLLSMKVLDFVGYAALPKELRGKRNVVTARPGAEKRMAGKGILNGRRDSAPRFRSEKDRKRIPDQDEEPTGDIPKYYRKVEIKYSKFGIEDFDFEYYNHTEYSGLETDILNSYTNALLQALHYITPVRAVAKAHLCVDCKKEHCLLCESGFLFRMLEDAKGVNCQASNFSRAFSATPQAEALGLIDGGEKSTAPYGSLIQNFNRWLLSTFSGESVVEGESLNLRSGLEGISLESPSAIDQVLGLNTRTTNTCTSCGFVSTRHSTLHAVDLAYPKKASDCPAFSNLLYESIVRTTSTRASCTNCRQFAQLESSRDIAPNAEFPPVLSVNAMVSSEDVFEVWKGKTSYLPRDVSFGGVLGTNGGVRYAVKSLVVQVQDTPEQPAHLVSFVKMPESWIIFNDFLVRAIPEEEVFSFPDQWKTPAVIILERVDSDTILDLTKLPKQISSEVLLKDVSMAYNRRNNMIKHKVLSAHELPKPGTLVAIDAEFVALQQEEMEFRSDGTKNILRPSHMSLARVSVLRGEGKMEGKPFIDDYIHTSETVVDYLTEFSGIKNGDLDPNNSPHTLVPLKVAYKKLRLLVDLGCVFIGHGLAKDFRTINIYIPPAQVLDTVNLYTSETQKRKLSLRFLTWFLLKKDIQTASHDSNEDARYALLLYKLYKHFEKDGRLVDVMEDIFLEGQKLGFKPPQDKDRAASPNPALGPGSPLKTIPAPSPARRRHLQVPRPDGSPSRRR